MNHYQPTEERLVKHPIFEWRYMDEQSGLVYPWYTEEALKWMKKIDFSKMRVFEYGAGVSTLWWRWNARQVRSIDNNKEWAIRASASFCDDERRYVQACVTMNNNSGELWDVIVIDGAWRDECTQYALKQIRKGGYIIIDNYHQPSVMGPEHWVKTDELLQQYPKVVFPQVGHYDWKTAVFQIV